MSLEFVIELVDKVSAGAKSASGGVSDLADKFGGLGESAGGAEGAMGSLGPALGATAGVAAAAAAAIGLAAAAIGALVYEGAKMALEANDFKGDTLDTLELLTGSSEAAQATFGQINAISNKLGTSRETTAKLATDLINAGVEQGTQLNSTIEAVANLTTVAGAGAASKIQGVIERAAVTGKFEVDARKLSGTGVSFADIAKKLNLTVPELQAAMKAGKITASQGLDALNATVNEKLGGIAAKQGLDIGNQMQRLKDNVSRLFEDVDTGPFLEALSQIGALFDENTASGQTMRAAIKGFFEGVFAAASAVLPYVKIFFQEIIIAGLKVYIALKPVIRWFEELFANAEAMAQIWETLKIVGIGLAFVLGILLAPIVVMLAFFAALTVATYAVIGAVAALIGFIVTGFIDLVNTAIETGPRIIQGLIDGITGGAQAVWDAVTNVAGGVKNAFKNALGISSPSKVFAEFGGYTAEGFAAGVDSGASEANAAIASMVQPPGVAAPGGTGAAGGIGNIEISVMVNAGNAGSPQEVGDMVAAKIAELMESIAMQQGVAA